MAKLLTDVKRKKPLAQFVPVPAAVKLRLANKLAGSRVQVSGMVYQKGPHGKILLVRQ